jgi:hypothetical protein
MISRSSSFATQRETLPTLTTLKIRNSINSFHYAGGVPIPPPGPIIDFFFPQFGASVEEIRDSIKLEIDKMRGGIVTELAGSLARATKTTLRGGRTPSKVAAELAHFLKRHQELILSLDQKAYDKFLPRIIDNLAQSLNQFYNNKISKEKIQGKLDEDLLISVIENSPSQRSKETCLNLQPVFIETYKNVVKEYNEILKNDPSNFNKIGEFLDKIKKIQRALLTFLVECTGHLTDKRLNAISREIEILKQTLKRKIKERQN